MADIDPALAYRTLTARASALRAEADAARKQSVAEAQEDDRRFGLRRDELDRERGALARDAELADAQAKLLEEQREMMTKSADDFEMDIVAGRAPGQAESIWQRNVEEGRAAAQQLADRAAAARADAAATRERLATVDRQRVQLDEEVRLAEQENQDARMAIFELDDHARLVAEAARRYGEAAAAGDDIPARAAAELAAEQALRDAATNVADRAAIRRVLPTFPDETPGLQDHGWPPAAPVVGPEETLDPFAADAPAGGADAVATMTSGAAALADPFDGAGDDAVATTDSGDWLEREGAVLGADASTVDPSGSRSSEQSVAVSSFADDGTGFGSSAAAGVEDAAWSPDAVAAADGYGVDATAVLDPVDTYGGDVGSAPFADEPAGGDEYPPVADGGDDTLMG